MSNQFTSSKALVPSWFSNFNLEFESCTVYSRNTLKAWFDLIYTALWWNLYKLNRTSNRRLGGGT